MKPQFVRRFRRLGPLLLGATLLALVLGSIGCHTAHGFGQDMEKAGEKIQDGTK
ncbi:MAG: entericidin A/B family lipoprotein [Verrucomicrobiia bacterium]